MNLKLDENLGTRGVRELREAGHDVATIFEQGLSGRADEDVFSVRCAENRTLVTIDAEFGNPLLYDARQSPGVVILRFKRQATPAAFRLAIGTLVTALQTMDPQGKLWIIQDRRIRIYQPETPASDSPD